MALDEKTYVDQAEKVIKKLCENKNRRGEPQVVTTSKLRNILAMAMEIYNQVSALHSEKLTDEINGRIEYLRVRIVYECGREKLVKQFVEESKILEYLKETEGSRKNYILFAHYLEALVAYKKYLVKEGM
jgi:CRISPR-associated protein Csm2